MFLLSLQLVNQENRLGVGPPVLVGLKKRIESKEKTSSGQLGSLRSSKVKVSDTVTSSKSKQGEGRGRGGKKKGGREEGL